MSSVASIEAADKNALSLNVRASSTQIAEFKAATFDTSPGVPIAFAFCWVTLPEVRARIANLLGATRLPLHESQSFEVIEPLEPDRGYVLELNFDLIESPPGLEIKGKVSRDDCAAILHMQTLLRLIPVVETAE